MLHQTDLPAGAHPSYFRRTPEQKAIDPTQHGLPRIALSNIVLQRRHAPQRPRLSAPLSVPLSALLTALQLERGRPPLASKALLDAQRWSTFSSSPSHCSYNNCRRPHTGNINWPVSGEVRPQARQKSHHPPMQHYSLSIVTRRRHHHVTIS